MLSLKRRFEEEGWSANRCAEICIESIKEVLNNYSADVDTVNDEMTRVYFSMLEEWQSQLNN